VRVPGAKVVGYVRGEEPEATEHHEAAIKEACTRQGWTLVGIVRDGRATKGGPLGRPGLTHALKRLRDGDESRLVVHRLEHLARSAMQLRPVLGWLVRNGIALTALDVGLDTSTPEGRTAVRSLLSVGASEQAIAAARARNGLTAARASGGRPAVSDRPELARRIREMRASGMTLQSISDRLNEEGVPTVRGGAEWRPSSVQSVLGYKRSVRRVW
jgi:DNA invertase Pin-like site-specific DNA recombinase